MKVISVFGILVWLAIYAAIDYTLVWVIDDDYTEWYSPIWVLVLIPWRKEIARAQTQAGENQWYLWKLYAVLASLVLIAVAEAFVLGCFVTYIVHKL